MTFWLSHPFPTQGSDKTWTLTESQIAEWSELYPGVDVDLTLRQALAWVLADQRRAKTAKGMKRFCVNWLNGAVNRGSAVKRTTIGPLVLHENASYIWQCPHVEKCANSWMCRDMKTLGRPEKQKETA